MGDSWNTERDYTKLLSCVTTTNTFCYLVMGMKDAKVGIHCRGEDIYNAGLHYRLVEE